MMKTPVAERKTLVMLAGLLWSVVGIALLVVAGNWLFSSDGNPLVPIGLTIVGGSVVYRFGFAKLTAVNLARIYAQAPHKDKVCLFAFQNRRSYYLIVIMMLLGYTLRHLPIDRIYLVPVYGTIGLGLFLASLGYFRKLIQPPGPFD